MAPVVSVTLTKMFTSFTSMCKVTSCAAKPAGAKARSAQAAIRWKDWAALKECGFRLPRWGDGMLDFTGCGETLALGEKPENLPSGAKARLDSAWFTYGLKPVPFTLKSVPITGISLSATCNAVLLKRHFVLRLKPRAFEDKNDSETLRAMLSLRRVQHDPGGKRLPWSPHRTVCKGFLFPDGYGLLECIDKPAAGFECFRAVR
jgi:hypothetical protein